MADLFRFLLGALATYRIARMIADEDGPADLFASLRGAVDSDQRTWVGRGLNCPLCVSVWVALVLAMPLGGRQWVLWWLALSGAATWLYKSELTVIEEVRVTGREQ